MLPDESTLYEMLKKEEEYKWSPEIQTLFDSVKDEPNGWIRITAELQERVCREFGYENVSDVVHLMRTAHLKYSDDKFKKVSMFVRENKARIGEYKINDILPSFDVYDLQGIKHPLNEYLNNYTVIFAGSHT